MKMRTLIFMALIVLGLSGCSDSGKGKQFVSAIGQERLKEYASTICVMDAHDIPQASIPKELLEQGVLKVLNAETGVYFVLEQKGPSDYGVYVRTEDNTVPDEGGGVSFTVISPEIYSFKMVHPKSD